MADRPYALRAVPGFHSNVPGIQLAAQSSNNASDEDLQFFQQLGIEWIMLGVNDPELHSAEHYKQFVTRFAEYGMQIYRIANHSVHNVPEITLNLPGRDKKIEEFIQFIRNLGEA